MAENESVHQHFRRSVFKRDVDHSRPLLPARRGDAMVAFAEGLQAADERYIATAEEKKDAVLMCCGTCAVAAYGAHRPRQSAARPAP